MIVVIGVVVLMRKKQRSAGAELTTRDRAGLVAIALFLLVVTISETFTGFNSILCHARSVGLFILGQVLQFTVVLAFPIVYVQYAPEPTTLQVKLVGFVLLIVLAVFGVLNSFQSAIDDQRQAFDPAPGPHSLVFKPFGESVRSESDGYLTRGNLT